MKPILEVRNLKKTFGKKDAVKDISFCLHEGEILGFLGVNGAGKTTTIQMLLGVLTPTSGDILYFSQLLRDHREHILEKVNFSSTYTEFPWDLTINEVLTYMSYLYSIPHRKNRVEEILTQFKLTSLRNKQIKDLSAGQMTRVNLAKAFINTPKVLLLDEPTASLDPDIAAYIRTFLLEQRASLGLSILLTSHNMAEVEEVCDRVLFLDKGEIIADNTPEKLAATIDTCHLELRITEGQAKLEAYCKEKHCTLEPLPQSVRIHLPEKMIAEFLHSCAQQGITYSEISINKPTLEDYFLSIAQK